MCKNIFRVYIPRAGAGGCSFPDLDFVVCKGKVFNLRGKKTKAHAYERTWLFTTRDCSYVMPLFQAWAGGFQNAINLKCSIHIQALPGRCLGRGQESVRPVMETKESGNNLSPWKPPSRECNQGGDLERQGQQRHMGWGGEAAGTSRPSPAAPVFLSSCCFFCLTNAEVNGIL